MKKHLSSHAHSYLSLLDGVGSVDEYAKRAKELGMTAFAITDHGNMSSAYLQHKACLKYGLKPIFGCEFYLKMESPLLIKEEIIINEESEEDITKDSEDNEEDNKGKTDVAKQERKSYHQIVLITNEEGWRNACKLNFF